MCLFRKYFLLAIGDCFGKTLALHQWRRGFEFGKYERKKITYGKLVGTVVYVNSTNILMSSLRLHYGVFWVVLILATIRFKWRILDSPSIREGISLEMPWKVQVIQTVRKKNKTVKVAGDTCTWIYSWGENLVGVLLSKTLNHERLKPDSTKTWQRYWRIKEAHNDCFILNGSCFCGNAVSC